MKSGVYMIEAPSGGRYVGSAVDFAARFRVHRHHLKKGNHHNPGLRRAAAKYGHENLIFRKIVICRPCDVLEYEQIAIMALRPRYNASPVAGSQLGFRHSPESIQRMSTSKIGISFHTHESRASASKRMIGNQYSAGLKLPPDRKAAFCEAGRLAKLAISFECSATAEQRESMVTDYATMSLPRLAEKYKIDHRTARRMLEVEGVKIRPQGGRFGEVPTASTRLKLSKATTEYHAARRAKQNGS